MNKIIVILALAISVNGFCQMKMADLEGKKIAINSKKEKRNIIKILEDNNYSVYYILDKRDFDSKIGVGTNGVASIIFFSKKYNKGILTNFEQMKYHIKKNTYNISLHTGATDSYMFLPSMIILDKDFNYEYLMKYSYIHLPNDRNIYTSSITIQEIKNYCNVKRIEIKGNAINENIDDLLSHISEINKDKTITKECNPIIPDMDLKDFFPKKINK